MDKDELYQQLRAARPPTAEEIAEVFASDTPLFFLLGEFLRQGDAFAQGIVSVDLTTDEGRLKALKQQGKAQGLLYAVDMVIDLVEEQKEKKNEVAKS